MPHSHILHDGERWFSNIYHWRVRRKEYLECRPSRSSSSMAAFAPLPPRSGSILQPLGWVPEIWAGRLRASSSSLCSLQGFIYTGKDKKIVPTEQCFWCSCWSNVLPGNVFFLSLFLCSSWSFVKYITTCYLPHSEALRPFVGYSLLRLSEWIAVYLQQILQEAIGVTCGKCNLIPYMHMFKWSAIKQT